MKKFAALAVLLAFVAGLVVESSNAQEKKEKKKPDLDAVFARMDTDGDGSLTLAEFKGKREGEKAEQAEKQFKAMDKNSDQKVSKEEFKARGKGGDKKKKKKAE